MNELLAYLAVFVAAAIPWLEVLLVVPAGIVIGLPWLPTVIVGVVGNIATLVPVVIAADRVESWWQRRRGSSEDAPDRRQGRARRVLDRYGVPGLAALGPLLTGAHLAAAVAMGSGAERRRVLLWFSAGIVLWALVAGVATALGLETFVDPERLPDLGVRRG